MKKVRDLLDRQAPRALVGRDRELDALLRCLHPDGPIVTFVYGIPGIGKSTLLDAFVPRARRAGTALIEIDGRIVEPSEGGFLKHLGDHLEVEDPSVQSVVEALAAEGRTVALVVDTYERLRLLESWLRRTFVPALPRNARLIAASRYPPSSRWFTDTGWRNVVRPLRLGPLSEKASGDLLLEIGVTEDQARRIQAFAHGHPLALRLAAVAALDESGPRFGDAGISRVVQDLSRRMLEEVNDPAAREALVAACAVRRTTVSLLAAIFPEKDARSLHGRLASLPFVYGGPDGLVVHEAVKESIATATRAHDPDRYRRYRRAAWEKLRAEVGDAGRSELWRYTADMLYLIENPICREAFFPSGVQELSVEPAGEDQVDPILEIVGHHEGPEAVDLMRYWSRVRRPRFRAVLEPGGDVAGFYFMLRADEARAAPQDPVAAAWLDHLAETGGDPEQTLLIRRWLSREEGESPSPVQAASWLDIKRTYVELRPDLRRVYLTVTDLGPYAEAAAELGFQPAPDLDRTVDDVVYHTAWLDFGPASVDGWLRRLAAAELGVEAEEPAILDPGARELVIDDRRVSLTPRELQVLAFLEERLGEAVGRDELLDAVWEDRDVQSNVVDSVVYSLRRKMGDEACRLETVRGFGYRLSRS